MTTLSTWVQGARPRTLGASIAPVLAGTAAAGHVMPWRFAAALLVGLGLQIGVNLANDYHDGIRGVDTARRAGPVRLTASGLAPPRAVLAAALSAVGVAGAAGLALALATTLWLVPIGAVAMAALWLYSGGPRPYAGLGLGEVSVFVFFGLMATAGSAFVEVRRVPATALWVSIPMGLLAVAILVANNLRDIPTDEATGKRTLAVRLGDRRTRRLYRLLVVAAFASIPIGVLAYIASARLGLTQWGLFGLAAWPLAIKPMEAVGHATGRDLIPVLTGTATTHAACGLLLTLGLTLSHL